MERNWDRFLRIYVDELKKAVQNFPDEYRYKAEDVPGVVARMAAAILRGSFNKDGRAFKGTCWNGAAMGHRGLANTMQEFPSLQTTWENVGSDNSLRHFFTEDGWTYCGKYLKSMAERWGVPHRVIEAPEDIETVYKDDLQVVTTKDQVASNVQVKEWQAGGGQ